MAPLGSIASRRRSPFWGVSSNETAPGVPFTFGALLDSANASFPRLESAPRPVYVFNRTGSKTDTWHDRGLTEHDLHGPSFTPNQPRICVVCQQSMKGQVEQFLHKFDQGIKLPPPPPSRDRSRPSKRQTNYFRKASAGNMRCRTSNTSFSLRKAARLIRIGRPAKTRWRNTAPGRNSTWHSFR